MIIASLVSCLFVLMVTLPFVAFGWFIAAIVCALRNPLPVEQEIDLDKMSDEWREENYECL